MKHKNFYRLIQGDSLKVLPTLEDQSIDLILTDPPWNIQRKEYDHITDFFEWFGKILEEFDRILKDNCSCLIEVGYSFLDEWIRRSSKYFEYKQPIILYLTNGIGRRSFVGWSCYSIILWFGKENAKVIRKFRDVIPWTLRSNKNEEWVYPNPKSKEAYGFLVRMFSQKEWVILDPFLGNGTTMLACEDNQRNCIGIEINPKYCEIVKKRCFGRKFLDREVEYKFEVFNE